MIKPPLTKCLFQRIVSTVLTVDPYSYVMHIDNRYTFKVSKQDYIVGCISFYKNNGVWCFEPDLFAGESEQYNHSLVMDDMGNLLRILNEWEEKDFKEIEEDN